MYELYSSLIDAVVIPDLKWGVFTPWSLYGQEDLLLFIVYHQSLIPILLICYTILLSSIFILLFFIFPEVGLLTHGSVTWYVICEC